MSRLARALAPTAVVAATLWWGPVSAQVGGTTTFKCTGTQSPSPNERECTPANGQVIDGKWKIAFNSKAGDVGRLRRVKLFVVSEDENILSPGQAKKEDAVPPVRVWGDGVDANDKCSDTPTPNENWASLSSAPNSRDLRCEWDTVVLTPRNAAFKIRVEATSHAGDTWSAERTGVKVDNAPAKPEKPKVVLATSEGVTVDWDESTDPDFRGYVIYRARTDSSEDRPGSGDFGRVTTISDKSRTRLLDEVSKGGAYWYRLQVLRRSIAPNNEPDDPPGEQCPCTIGSPPSDTSADAGVVVPVTPGPPTPAPPTVAPPTPTPKPPPKPKIIVKPPPVPDAPFSAVLPYPEDAETGPAEAEQPEGEVAAPPVQRDEGGSRAAVLPVAVGAFLVSAALLLGRLPV